MCNVNASVLLRTDVDSEDLPIRLANFNITVATLIMLCLAYKHSMYMDRGINRHILSYGLLPLVIVALALCEAQTCECAHI